MVRQWRPERHGMQKQLAFGFAEKPPEVSAKKASNPKGYTGLYGFHKYWGKKPHEPLAFIIEQLTSDADTVLDPFVGSGITARESLLRNRRFIGFDINPIAVEITRLLVSPPDYESVYDTFKYLEKSVKEKIGQTYLMSDGCIASHYLWENDLLQQVWLRRGLGNAREERSPSAHDLELIDSLAGYRSKFLRRPNFFSNGRINAHKDLAISDILTGRAQHNLDLLLHGIAELPDDLAKPLRLCLTAASGQMTKMVFAVTGRGKTGGKASSKVEVGSWVIGYWRPKLHFEVNVWNCFERRVSKLLKAIRTYDPLTSLHISPSLAEFYRCDSKCCIECTPCQDSIAEVANQSVKLILTDPPHSDRVPYLELSELWNAILGLEPNFDDEIVISNAKEREKSPETYGDAMNAFFAQCRETMRDDGFLVLLYNARQEDRWTFVNKLIDDSASTGLEYIGQFPCNYSAGSVVQDNRKGGLKNDVALVFGNPDADLGEIGQLCDIPNWTTQIPFH
ncbi:MAG: hypothetical protein CEE38_02195 [Planctomycetes bacterium B3_Pla]|nr:MAG: hypothetical protein CEE38_02195 [Planctomycetes bacterium B3_Pla]